jgi:hypothetical protein
VRLPSRSSPQRTTLPHIIAARECSAWLVVAPAHAVHHAATAVVIGLLMRENCGVAAPSPDADTVPRASSYFRTRSAKYATNHLSCVGLQTPNNRKGAGWVPPGRALNGSKGSNDPGPGRGREGLESALTRRRIGDRRMRRIAPIRPLGRLIRSGNARAKRSFADLHKSAHRFCCRALHNRARVRRTIVAGACSGSAKHELALISHKTYGSSPEVARGP